MLGGTEHRYSLQCIASFFKTNCWVCSCVSRTNSCNSSILSLTSLIRLQNHVHPSLYHSIIHSPKNIRSMPKQSRCHAMSCLPSTLCASPPLFPFHLHTEHACLPSHPINPRDIVPPLPLVRLTQPRLADCLASGHVLSCYCCCCSPAVVAVALACPGLLLLLPCCGFAA